MFKFIKNKETSFILIIIASLFYFNAAINVLLENIISYYFNLFFCLMCICTSVIISSIEQKKFR